MTRSLDQNRTTPSPKTSRQAARVQVSAVGLAFLGALMLAALVFLATGRGSETEALGVFPLWVLLFFLLVRRATDWRQTVSRGLIILGIELLALPLAWLLYQGPPSLSDSDPRLPQTLGVLALGLSLAAPLLVGGFWLHRRRQEGPALQGEQALQAALAVFYLAGAAYGLLLWAGSLGG